MMGNNSNVIAFEQHGAGPKKPEAPSEALGLLNGCRDRLIHGVSTGFAEGISGARDHLFDLADSSSSLQMQTLYFAAQRSLSTRGQEILQRFRAAFTRSFDTAVISFRETTGQSHADAFIDLSLVKDSDFERDLAIGKLSSRTLYNCTQQLIALERRMAAIQGVSQIHQDSNPLFPKTLFTAFLKATEEMDISDQIGIALVQEFERQIQGKLPNLYGQINSFLVDNGVLPKIPLGLQDKIQPMALAERSEPHQPSNTEGIEPAPQVNSADHLFAQLMSRLKSGYEGSIAEASFYDAPPPDLLQTKILEALTSIQRGSVNHWALPGIEHTRDDQGTSAILRQIRTAPIISQANAGNAVTTDIVAALFDYLLADSDIPESLRVQLGRLQIPVLKVALMDKGFFSNHQHPARRLLDLMANASLGWNDRDAPRLYAKIKSIVDEVVQKFDRDVAVIASQPDKLESFIAKEDERARKRNAELASEIDRSERARNAELVATQQVHRQMEAQDLPPLIRNFLNKIWRLVLALTYAKSGADSRCWRGALRTMNDLIWSVTPKAHKEQRQRLYDLLPGLLERLDEGIELLKLNREDKDEFFSQLAQLLANTVAPGTKLGSDKSRAEDEIALSKLETSSLAENLRTEFFTGISPEILEQGQRSIDRPIQALSDDTKPEISEHPHTQEPGTAEQEDGDEHLRRARKLEVGARVEFCTKRGNRRTFRLTWISGLRNIFLFTDRQGDDALTLPVIRLAERLRDDSARVLTDGRLTHRAIGSMLK